MKEVTVIIIRNQVTNKILSVSRKYDKTLFGLVGGKVDETDKDIYSAIIRECFEETGLIISKKNIKLVDSRMEGKNFCHCFYTNKYTGNILSQNDLDDVGETGVVKWLDKANLENGFCGDYNKAIFEKLKL